MGGEIPGCYGNTETCPSKSVINLKRFICLAGEKGTEKKEPGKYQKEQSVQKAHYPSPQRTLTMKSFAFRCYILMSGFTSPAEWEDKTRPMKASPLIAVKKGLIIIMSVVILSVAGCVSKKTSYRTFADYPGFKEYYSDRCSKSKPVPPIGEDDKSLLRKYRPRLILPPGGRYPIDFYRDYLPFTVMRRYPEKTIVAEHVTPDMLKANQGNTWVYLDLQLDRFRAAGLGRQLHLTEQQDSDQEESPAVYGRVYRETVTFPKGDGDLIPRDLIFLKYSTVFATSGLTANLPRGFESLLRVMGLDLEDWHELDNFGAIYVVLDEKEIPIAAMLAQHNHHRTYLVGKDISLPIDARMAFDIALRSNEIYPASYHTGPAKHRAVRRTLYMKYLLSGEDPPLFRGYDITYGVRAGGKEISYDLAFLSPCDPFYTARMMLGEPRPFLGRNIGRNGPPGADYYAIPPLLPLGNLLKFSYLRDGDPDDIAMIDRAIDLEKRKIDVVKIMEHGGRRFYHDLTLVLASGRQGMDGYF